MSAFTVAAAQVAPVFLSRDATVEKACTFIRQAASHGAKLVVFPEAYIPTYPDWVWAVPPGDGSVPPSVTSPKKAASTLSAAAWRSARRISPIPSS
jgi:predicted amidohydrolase